MTSVQIRNVTAGGATLAINLVEGGFDPVPVSATAGDQLEIAFTDGRGAIGVALDRVPERRPPAVVRIVPPRGRTDVALSTRPTVVFSEPVDPGTLAAGVRLLTGGATVDGSVALLPDRPWMAEFVPAAALEPGTTYELQITEDVHDLDGDGLEEPVTVTFTTVPGSAVAGSLGQVAFVSTRDGSPYIYVADADGSNVKRLTQGEKPAWSWDGQRLAFVRDGVIYVMDADGTERSLRQGSDPAWSPAGRIAFRDPWAERIMVMTATGVVVQVLLTNAWVAQFNWLPGYGMDSLLGPAWSPDGQTIAFHFFAGYMGSKSVGLVNADASDPRDLQAAYRFFGPYRSAWGRPAWSPDGSRIAVQTSGWAGGAFISVYDAASGKLEMDVPGVPSWPENPSWSPDGEHLLFAAGSAERKRIFAVSLETGAVQQLIPDAVDPFAPDYMDYDVARSPASP